MTQYSKTSLEEKISLILTNFSGCQPDALIQLGGYNNTNYKAILSNKNYFVKFANRHEQLVGSSLQNEIECMTMVHPISISPKLVFHDPQESIMVTEFIDGKFNFQKQGSKSRYIKLLHSLHNSNIQFPNEFFPLKAIQRHEELARERGVSLPEILSSQILPKIYSLKEEELFLHKTPCHLDPQFDNILDNGEALYLVDWEFASMSEPLFDLANMCASEQFSDSEMKEILTLYLQKNPNKVEWDRFSILRVIADLRMCLFCYLFTSITTTNPDTYKEFAGVFLKQIKKRFLKYFPPRER